MSPSTSTVEIYRPVETRIGFLDVRGAIFLLSANFERPTLTLEGGVSGLSATNASADWYHFHLVFDAVLAVRITDLASWSLQDVSSWQVSSFDEVVDSRWHAALGGKAGPDHRHFSVLTNDDVFEVLCHNHRLTLSDGRNLEG